MLGRTLVELTLLDFIFWTFVFGIVFQLGRELVMFIFEYGIEEDSEIS